MDVSILTEQKSKVAQQVAFVNRMLDQRQTVVAAAPTATSNTTAKTSRQKRAPPGRPASKPRESSTLGAPSPAMLGAMTAQMAQIGELIDSKMEAVERRWQTQFKKLDERVKLIEREQEVGKQNAGKLADAVSDLRADVEKKDARNVALMKKLHGIHAQELEEKTAAVRQEQQSNVESLHDDLRAQSRELIRLKTALDEALAQQDKTSGKVAAALDDSLSALVSELCVRVGKIETRQYLRGEGGSPAASGEVGPSSAAARREDKMQLAALRESLAELSLQMSDFEAEQSYLSGAVKAISASIQGDRHHQKQSQADNRDDEMMASLQKKIHGVGKHASKAIRGLSEGMQDIQHSILALYSWSNSVNAKLYLPLFSVNVEGGQRLSTASPTAAPHDEDKSEGGLGDSQRAPHDEILAALRSSSSKLAAGGKETWFDV